MTDDKAEGKKAKKAKAPKAPKEPKKSSGSPIAGIRQWLIDSYNGIFKIVVQPQLPKSRLTGLMVFSLLFGMMWAYVLAPIVFFNGAPHQMSQAQRDQYIKLVAGSYVSGVYDESQTTQLLSRVEDPASAINRMLQSGSVTSTEAEALQIMQPLVANIGGTPAPQDGGILASVLTFVIAVIAFILIINVFALLWGLLIGGIVQRTLARFRPKTAADLDAEKTIAAIKERQRIEKDMKERLAEQAAASSFGPPMMNKISVYTKGRQFDDSFAIEDANDMFLGECGATIAKTIGDKGELAAVEIWLFDKEDFVRTLTRVFASEHAYRDPISRAEIDARVDNPETDIVVFAPNAIIMMETKALRLEARVQDMSYGSDPTLPDNSFIEKLTLSISAWEQGKAGAPAAAPAPAPMAAPPAYAPPPAAMPAAVPAMPAAPAYTPPPTPGYAPPPPPSVPFGGPRPAPVAPPPPPGFPPARPEDDDPFGGTGDFTPIGS